MKSAAPSFKIQLGLMAATSPQAFTVITPSSSSTVGRSSHVKSPTSGLRFGSVSTVVVFTMEAITTVRLFSGNTELRIVSSLPMSKEVNRPFGATNWLMRSTLASMPRCSRSPVGVMRSPRVMYWISSKRVRTSSGLRTVSRERMERRSSSNDGRRLSAKVSRRPPASSSAVR